VQFYDNRNSRAPDQLKTFSQQTTANYERNADRIRDMRFSKSNNFNVDIALKNKRENLISKASENAAKDPSQADGIEGRYGLTLSRTGGALSAFNRPGVTQGKIQRRAPPPPPPRAGGGGRILIPPYARMPVEEVDISAPMPSRPPLAWGEVHHLRTVLPIAMADQTFQRIQSLTPAEIMRLSRVDLARQSNGTMVNYAPSLNDDKIFEFTSPLQQNMDRFRFPPTQDRRYGTSFSNSDDSDSMSAEASLNNWDNLSLMQNKPNIYEDAIEEYDRTSSIPNSGAGAGAGGRSGLRAPPYDTPPRPKPQQKRNSKYDSIFPKRKASKKPLEWDTGTPERGRRQQTLDRYLTKKVRGKSS
jgi:hypothetical protein